MTLPHERYYALRNARQFLLSLLDRSATPRVPLDIRRQARWVLKHFPHEYELREIAAKAPKILVAPDKVDSCD